jgi:DNA-binding response OmpR family regulator
VVADVEMGVMTGYELCRRVRASGRDSIPFLFCSGRGSPDSRVEGLQAGADDYLVKPVRSEELILKLARQVERVRKLREAASGARPAVVNAATLAAIEARLDVQGTGVVRLGRFEVRSIPGARVDGHRLQGLGHQARTVGGHQDRARGRGDGGVLGR